MRKIQSSGLLFELLRSFTTLARTLNLSKSVRELDSTRQTVRRHISLLEDRKGEPLFVLEDRQYQLTDAGRRSLPEAKDLLGRGEAWLNNQTGHINGLAHIIFDEGAKFSYYLQQHPLGRLWEDGSTLLQKGFQCWADAKGQIEADAFAPIRPYLVIYRQLESNWICMEVGSESSYANWQGWQWARSSVGRGLPNLPGGAGFADLLVKPFQEVCNQETLRFDHIHTQLPDKDGKEMIPVSYQRLLLGCRLPDGSFALAMLVNRTHDIVIEGLSSAQVKSMPQEYVMDIKAI